MFFFSIIGRGRLIPTLPFEAPWNAISQWLGIANDYDLETILPNRKSFPGMLFDGDEIFVEDNYTSNILGNNSQCSDEGTIVSCNPGSGGSDDDGLFTDDDDNLFTDDYYYYNNTLTDDHTDDLTENDDDNTFGEINASTNGGMFLSTIIPALSIAITGVLFCFVVWKLMFTRKDDEDDGKLYPHIPNSRADDLNSTFESSDSDSSFEEYGSTVDTQR